MCVDFFLIRMGTAAATACQVGLNHPPASFAYLRIRGRTARVPYILIAYLGIRLYTLPYGYRTLDSCAAAAVY